VPAFTGVLLPMESIIALARQGQSAAVSVVVESLRPRISRMAAYYARRTGHDHDDLMQEALLGMLEALPNLRLSVGCPNQHLIMRARWRLLDTVRRENLRRCQSVDDAELIKGDVSDVEHAVISTAFVDSLNPIQRTIIACLIEGMTWRETGDVLGCSSANIAYHVRRIRHAYEAWDSCPRGL
jgi:RNA polymerase sigma factor (sigma-70 family)